MKSKEFQNVLFIISIVISAAAIYVAAYLGANYNNYYFAIFFAAVPFIFMAVQCYGRIKLIKAVEESRKNWSKEKKSKRDMKLISGFYKSIPHDEEDKFYIDDQTWNDLTMDDIYAKIDRTITTPGEEVLYSILRSPYVKGNKLKNRDAYISEMQKNVKLREDIEASLIAIGKQKGNVASSVIFNKNDDRKPPYAFVYDILAVLAVLSVVSIAFLGIKGVFECVVPIFIINSIIHYKIKEGTKTGYATLRYIASVVSNSKTIADSLKGTVLDDYSKRIIKNYNICKAIAKKGSGLLEDNGTVAPLMQYPSIFLLIEVRNYCAVINKIIKYNDNLGDIYRAIGEIDSYISVASYRDGLESYTEPDISEGEAYVDIEDACHPLIPGAVPNSITIKNEGIIITGTNMSGKSTFLRTIGVNVLFAQTISTCIASSYNGHYLRIMTSISSGDNIIGGKSYYMAEAEALLKIVKSSDGSVPLFCMIDEIFRGTNSVERIAASAEILKYLVEHNAIAIVATHDLELVDLIGNTYRYFYFTEDMDKEGLKFDYKIKQGVSQNRNAVRIMKYLGYPDEIIDNTNERIGQKL